MGCRFVPGVEISASWRAQTLHVLGLWIDPPAAADLRAALLAQGERRRSRMRKMCARLEKLGLPGMELLAAVQAHPGLPTRTHLAHAMVAGGHVGRSDDAFRKYLGSGKAAHMSRRTGPLSRSWWAGSAPPAAWPRSPIRRATRCRPVRAGSCSADFVAAGGSRARSRLRRQWRAVRRRRGGARGEVRSHGVGGLGFSRP